METLKVARKAPGVEPVQFASETKLVKCQYSGDNSYYSKVLEMFPYHECM